MENNTSISARAILKDSFKLAKKHFWSYAVVILCFIVISIIDPNQRNYPGSGLVGLISMALSIYVSFSAVFATIRIVKGETLELKDFFVWPKNGFKSLLTSIVTSLIYLPVILAYIFLILSAFIGGGKHLMLPAVLFFVLLVPSVYFGVRLLIAKYYSLEYGFMPGRAVAASWKATGAGKFWPLFRLVLLSALVGILGFVALFVGIFWAIPTIIFAQIIMYKKLSGENVAPMEEKSTESLPEVQPLELQANTASEVANSDANN